MNTPPLVETTNVDYANQLIASGVYRKEKITDNGKYILAKRVKPLAPEVGA